MFENLFSPSPWVWTGLVSALVSLPILIHLINLLRHRRVQWAAMDFLMHSHKRHRHWIRFKQLLLLASRVCILLLALFMLAQVGCEQDDLSHIFGERTTHHYVLVDDSYSMSDTQAGESALDRAREALSLIAARAKGRSGQRFTVLRFSRCSGNSSLSAPPGPRATPSLNGPIADASLDELADINAAAVDKQFDQTILRLKNGLEVSSSSTGPLPALRVANQLIQSRSGETAIVYVVSDFRSKDWSRGVGEASGPLSPELAQPLAELHQQGVQLEMIRCVREEQPNLSIVDLQVEGNVRVAGIPLMMNVHVKNFGKVTARNVEVKIRSAQFSGGDTNQLFDSSFDDLPVVFIDEIAAGEVQTRRFVVFNNSPGAHILQAQLRDDALNPDNTGWAVVELEPACKVLVVDDENQFDARFVSLALDPNTMTGVEASLVTRDYLRDATLEELDSFNAIFLLDVSQLDASSVASLTQYVTNGGGVAFFLGPKANLKHYTSELYRAGAGLFPMPLASSVSVPEPTEGGLADIAPAQHPIFRSFIDVKTSPLDLVQIKQYVRAEAGWWMTEHPQVQVLATVRGDRRAPLIVEKKTGRGKVIAVTTTAGPTWNNWSRNATFPAVMLLLQDYLSSGRFSAQRRLVGEPWQFEFPVGKYPAELTVVAPNDHAGERVSWKQTAQIHHTDERLLTTTIGGEGSEATRWPGVCEILLGGQEPDTVKRRAFNLDVAESDLALSSAAGLAGSLSDSAEVSYWDEFQSETSRHAGTSLSKFLLVVLLVFLAGEQLLGFFASYHPVRPPG